jgi:hypothetical protein
MTARPLKVAFAAALIALAVGACERKSETPPATPAPAAPQTPAPTPAVVGPEGFQHDADFDAQGFFIPQKPIRIGDLKLRHIAFGAPSDFKQWEAGDRASVFGPVLLYFEDETSPTNTNEMGEDVHTVAIRVLPTGYRVFPGAVSFRATDPKLGEIGFVGAIDAKALASAHEAGPGDNRVAMTGTLRVGDATFENARFTYFMGD